MISRLNDILFQFSFYFKSFKRLIISFKRYNRSFKRDICRFDYHSNFLVSISALIHNWKGNVPSGIPYFWGNLHELNHA